MKRLKSRTKSAKKKRPAKYETRLKLNCTFEDAVKMVVSGNPKSTKA